MSRNKGKRGEREVVKLLQPVVDEVYAEFEMEPPLIERNLMQSNRGGYDLVGLQWVGLEVKLQEQENLSGWWKQCKDQCSENQEPVLFYRRNRVAWKVQMFGFLVAGEQRVRAPVVISVEAFLAYLRIRLRKELQANQD
jgi:hypothetical protein